MGLSEDYVTDDDDDDDDDDADYLRTTQLKVTVSSTPLYSRGPEPKPDVVTQNPDQSSQ